MFTPENYAIIGSALIILTVNYILSCNVMRTYIHSCDNAVQISIELYLHDMKDIFTIITGILYIILYTALYQILYLNNIMPMYICGYILN